MPEQITDISAPPEPGFSLMVQDETFVDHVGPFWRRMTDGGATILLPVQRKHVNPNGVCHGGVLMTLLDNVLGSSAECVLAAEQSGQTYIDRHPTTIQISCNMIGPARQGDWLRATARVDRMTRTMAFVSGRIEVGERLVSSATAIFKLPRVAKDG